MFIDITGLFYYIKCIKSIHTAETRTDMCEKVCCKLACISAFCTGLRIKVASCIERRMPMILLDYKDRRPIYEQVVSKFEELMLLGAMKENEPLPSVRSLALYNAHLAERMPVLCIPNRQSLRGVIRYVHSIKTGERKVNTYAR